MTFHRTITNAVQIGKIGEHITAAVIEQIGYRTNIVNQTGFDIIFFDDNGLAWRVEVKSASSKIANRPAWVFMTSKGSGAKKLLSESDCDIVALVALDIRKVAFRHVRQLKSKRSRITVNEFDEPEAIQLKKCMDRARR